NRNQPKNHSLGYHSHPEKPPADVLTSYSSCSTDAVRSSTRQITTASALFIAFNNCARSRARPRTATRKTISSSISLTGVTRAPPGSSCASTLQHQPPLLLREWLPGSAHVHSRSNSPLSSTLASRLQISRAAPEPLLRANRRLVRLTQRAPCLCPTTRAPGSHALPGTDPGSPGAGDGHSQP